MRRAPATGIPDDFRLTESTEDFLNAEFPTVNAQKTLEIFRDKAEAGGWLYSNWQSAFKNYVRNGQKFGGIVYNAGREQDPRWQPVLAEAMPYGFRAPLDHETPNGYRVAFESWKTKEKRSENVLPFAQDFARRFGRPA